MAWNLHETRQGAIMGDSRRFDLFAKLIRKNFSPEFYPKVADIAGGKGYLQSALKDLGYTVTTFDKRRKRVLRSQYQYRFFDKNVKEEFNLLVGMHPNEATDVIIVEASKRGIPFVICPCCVKPSAVVYWGKHSYKEWTKHLKKLAKERGYRITEADLPMNGKSLCLIGRLA